MSRLVGVTEAKTQIHSAIFMRVVRNESCVDTSHETTILGTHSSAQQLGPYHGGAYDGGGNLSNPTNLLDPLSGNLGFHHVANTAHWFATLESNRIPV